MKAIYFTLQITIFSLMLQGCAGISAEPFKGAHDNTEGIRFYEPTPFLIVTGTKVNTVFIPNPKRGIAIGFNSWLAKHKAELKVEQGVLTELSSDVDATAVPVGFLTLLQTLGQEALKTMAEAAKNAPGAAALGDEVDGTITNKEGVYLFNFDDNGNFIGLTKMAM